MCESLSHIYHDSPLTPNIIILHEDGCLYKWTPAQGWFLHQCPLHEEVLVSTHTNHDGVITHVYEVYTSIAQVVALCAERRTPCCSPIRQQHIPQPLDADIFEMPKRKRGRPKKEKRNTRPPTEYNEFIKAAMVDVKEQYPKMANKDRLLECARLWRKHKNKLNSS